MSKANKVLIAIVVAAFAGYAIYLNVQLKDTVKRYETSALDMADKFDKINEDAMRAREELARQKAIAEAAKAEAESVKAEAAKLVEEAKLQSETEAAAKEAEPVNTTKEERAAIDAKARAEAARAKAEALIGAIDNEANAWETREAHL